MTTEVTTATLYTGSMDGTKSDETVFWVVTENDHEQSAVGAFLAPAALSFDGLYDMEQEWRARQPDGNVAAFLDWLASEHGVRRVPVEVYPFG